MLLVVLDTVAAGHLSVYNYGRATSPTLAEIAGRGIRFDLARAACSWTLPSHATMFTGRWLHELSVGWFTPLDQTYPTLAEYLGVRGYATAGFIANTGYCAAHTGLARGFTRYEDYAFPELTALKTGVLVDRGLERLRAIVYYAEDWLDSAGLLRLAERVVRALDGDRKEAKTVNRELLDWLKATWPSGPAVLRFPELQRRSLPLPVAAGAATPIRNRADRPIPAAPDPAVGAARQKNGLARGHGVCRRCL